MLLCENVQNVSVDRVPPMSVLDSIFKMRLSRLLLAIIVLLVAVPIVTHYFLSGVDSSSYRYVHTASKMDTRGQFFNRTQSHDRELQRQRCKLA
jgi:hypothetical protein